MVGGWASDSAGYGSTYGTSLDISGKSTWYHRLAFHTNGTIDYWTGINTNTLTKQGTLITSANIGSQSVNYATSANYANSAGSASSVAWANVSGKPSTYTPPTATSSVLGGVKVGSNISVSFPKLSPNSPSSQHILSSPAFCLLWLFKYCVMC